MTAAAHQSLVLTDALRYAGKGKPIFPCGADKTPLTSHGFQDATTDQKKIQAWWEQHPDAMIGMPTGKLSIFTVLDVDVDPAKGIDGNDTLYELEQKHGKLPDTPEALTPRGGRHLYFKYVPGLRNSAGKLGRGLDIRGEGGYVIVPLSQVRGKGQYEWEASNPKTLAEMPPWMVNMLLSKARTPTTGYLMQLSLRAGATRTWPPWPAPCAAGACLRRPSRPRSWRKTHADVIPIPVNESTIQF